MTWRVNQGGSNCSVALATIADIASRTDRQYGRRYVSNRRIKRAS
jgi:hypothetical protein